jgi:hypothetical protein
MPAQQCQHCGQAIDPSFEGSADSTVTTPPAAAPTVPPNSPPADPQPSEDDSAKVVRLLQHIASQSHFEDRYEVRGVLDRGGMGQIFAPMTASFAARSPSR